MYEVTNVILICGVLIFVYRCCEFNMSLCEVQKQSQKLTEVILEQENWNIIVRVIRSWFVPDFSKQRCLFSMDLVIQDN